MSTNQNATPGRSVSLDLRAVNVRSRVTVFQSLEFIGVRLLHGHSTQQLICPFHDDTKPSARVYEDSGKVFCFTCHKVWDTISLVQDSRGVGFADAVQLIEDAFKLQSPLENLPLTVQYNVSKRQSTAPSLVYLAQHVEERIMARKSELGLKKFAKYLMALDLTVFYLHNKQVTEAQYRDTLTQILTKLRTTV